MPESKGRADAEKLPSSSNKWMKAVWLVVSVVATILAYVSKTTQTSRQNWKEGTWILVNIVFVAFATIGMVRTINIPSPITVLLWVVAGYIFVFQIVRRLWDELRRKIEGLAEPLREIASQKALYTVFKMVVPETRAEEVLEGLGVPVLRRTMDLQRTHPLETRLKMSFRGDREEITGGGELLVVTRTISWTASLLEAQTSLKQLVKPIFVCTSYVRQIPWINRLVEGGYIDLLWPIPAGWIEDEALNNLLQKTKWLEFSRLKISACGDVKSILKPLSKKGEPMSFDSIWEVLHASDTEKLLPKKDDVANEIVNKLPKHCMQVLYIDDDKPFCVPSKNGAFTVFIDQESTYKVWVSRGEARKDEILYRFEVPFLQPAFVQDITFELVGQSPDYWILDPASVHCPFPLINDESRLDSKRQDLCWESRPEEGTPFLPGHGVAFMWRKKPNNKQKDTSDS